MKKALSIILCSVFAMATFYANAAMPLVVHNSIDFSNENLWGQTPRYGLDEDGGAAIQTLCFWYSSNTNGNASVITNYQAGIDFAYDRFGDAGKVNPRPDYMRDGFHNTGYLDVATLYPLQRAFNPVTSDAGISMELPVPSDDGLFVDTLVQFWARENPVDEIPTETLNGRAKFMCWLSSAGAGAPQLVITAGHYNRAGELETANYLADVQVQQGRWYRLTARAIKDASTNDKINAPMFVLYLDGVPVSCKGEYKIGEDLAKMDSMFIGDEYYAKKALFPPMAAFGDEERNPKLSGFAVRGRAAFDEYGVVKAGNPLAYPATKVEMTVALDPVRVPEVVCKITSGGTTREIKSTDKAEITFEAGHGDIVEIEAKVSDGYLLRNEPKLSGNTRAVANMEGYRITLADDFEDASRLVARINTGDAYFFVGDKSYETVQEAVEAAALSADKTLVLGKDVTLDKTTENGQMYIKANYELILDLRGKTITGEHFEEEAVIYDKGRFTIIDTVGGGNIIASGTAIEIAAENDALVANHQLAVLTLGSDETADNDFTIIGRVRREEGALIIKGGTYLTPPELEPRDDFYLAQYVPDARYQVGKTGSEQIAGKTCNYWSVAYDGKLKVEFKVAHGEYSPKSVNVEKGSKLVEPVIVAPGWTLIGWKNEATGETWNFAEDSVEENLVLTAEQSLDEYKIEYSNASMSSSAIKAYNVEMEKEHLPAPMEKEHFTFSGWLVRGTNKYVDFVGKGAVYVGTEELVLGDLDLVAQWTPAEIVWTNAGTGLAESNGTYSGTLKFSILGKGAIHDGDKIAIDKIAFALVNPHLYPKTSPYLVMVDGKNKTASNKREYTVDEESMEYIVGGEHRLINGRAAVEYQFDNLTIEVGKFYEVYLANDSLEPMRGFIRWTLMPNKNDAVFGNCTVPGGDPASEKYLNYCPTYEVRGHFKEVENE